MFRPATAYPALLLALLPMAFLLPGCQADEPPAPLTGEELGGGDTDDDRDDPPGSNDNDDDGNDDEPGNNDNDDTGDGGGNAKLDARCGAGEEFLPLARGIKELDDLELDIDADVDDECKDCKINGEKAVLSGNLSHSARIYIPAGTRDGANITLRMDDPLHGVDAAGFLVSGPGRYLSGKELQRVSIRLLLDDAPILHVDGNSDDIEVHDTGDNFRQLLVVRVPAPFDGLRIRLEGDDEEFMVMEVFAACVDSYGRKQD